MLTIVISTQEEGNVYLKLSQPQSQGTTTLTPWTLGKLDPRVCVIHNSKLMGLSEKYPHG